jgi:glucose-1-phosphate cytidylyltransferase
MTKPLQAPPGHEDMKVAILAGGVGSRLMEETTVRPKPMVEIGGKPIMWHIMRHYAHFGFKNFVIALGYKGEYIKKYMVDYSSLNSNLKVNLGTGAVEREGDYELDWSVELIDTGVPTGTGGRIKRLIPYMGGKTFFLTWGDGVSDVDLHRLLEFHKAHGKLCTVTAVRPTARFGHLEFGGSDGNAIVSFDEKPQTAEGWINGAFFACEPEIFDYIPGDETMFEREPLEGLARDGQLMAYKHNSYWQCMDTLRDKVRLEELWQTGQAPWKLWE